MTNKKLRRLIRALDRLDEVILDKPGRHFSNRESGRPIMDALNKLDYVFIGGFNKLCDWVKYSGVQGGRTKKMQPRVKTGKPATDAWVKIKYWMAEKLDELDARTLYDGRHVKSKAGRFRSKSERRIAEMLRDSGVKFRYEKPLKLGKVKLHPDFYLPKEDVYLEFWGLADSDAEYAKVMNLKKRLYRKHDISVISMYPRHMRNLDESLPSLYEETTGKKFPL